MRIVRTTPCSRPGLQKPLLSGCEIHFEELLLLQEVGRSTAEGYSCYTLKRLRATVLTSRSFQLGISHLISAAAVKQSTSVILGQSLFHKHAVMVVWMEERKETLQ